MDTSQIDSIKRQQEEELTKQKADVYKLPYIDLSTVSIDENAFFLISENEAAGEVAILKEKGDILQIAVFNPNSPRVKSILKRLREDHSRLDIFIGSKTGIKETWEKHTKKEVSSADITGSVSVDEKTLAQFKGKITTVSDFEKALKDLADQNASHVFEIILSSALAMEATDIHIEPQESDAIIRLKLDGLLYEVADLNKRLYKLVLSRVKLLSELKLNVHDSPQEGRFSVVFEGRVIEIRASILPAEYDEDIALRILDPKFLLSLSDLGIREDLLAKLRACLKEPQGVLFVTGPTGSGKTTTLYASIMELKTPEVKIITIEDPIEYHVRGTTQTQVNEEKDYTFSAGLKSILRQDPDIVLIGELRETESAEVALQAALAGRKVLTTLHTIDAAGTAPRLTDLGLDPATVSSAITASIAQRLIRKLCSDCKEEIVISENDLEKFSALLQNLPDEVTSLPLAPGVKIYKAKEGGCEKCRGTGYKGRVGIFEILVASRYIREKISEAPTEDDLREFAVERGMTTIKQDGAIKILEGATSIDEVERIIGTLGSLK